MNGVHDLGGLQSFGPVQREPHEPLFHHDWERRVLALTLAMGASRQWTIDHSRAARESLPPARYLASSYYQIWLDGLQKLLLERNLVTPEEMADGRVREAPSRAVRVLTASQVASTLARGSSTQREPESAARFGVGDAVRARVMNPPTHTRLPRYCRGRRGIIIMVHGAHVFPDTNASGEGEQPQWLYTVRFAAHELWGPDTTATAVHVDCWEPYLEAG